MVGLMLQRSCIACYSTPKANRFWDIFRDSLIAIGVEESQILHHREPDLPDGGSGFQSRQWYESTSGKVRWFADQLGKASLESDFLICSDVDIWFPPGRESGWKELEAFLDLSPQQIFAAREPWGGSGPSNTGFLVIKKSHYGPMSTYLRDVSTQIEQRSRSRQQGSIPFSDQSLINDDLRKRILPFDFIPDHLCSLGGPGIASKMETMIFHHACGAFNECQKIEQFARVWNILGFPEKVVP